MKGGKPRPARHLLSPPLLLLHGCHLLPGDVIIIIIVIVIIIIVITVVIIIIIIISPSWDNCLC